MIRRTWAGAQRCPPRGAGTPRAIRASAISASVAAPARRALSMYGRTTAARRRASSICTALPFAEVAGSRASRRGLPSCTPRAFAAGAWKLAMKGGGAAYLPRIWWPVMTIIRGLPTRIFNRLDI